MSETALLEAVRDQIRERCGYGENQCNIEPDEMAPPMAGEFYVCVLAGGWQPGPNCKIGGGVLDEVFTVEVSVLVRAARVPRDKRRSLFLDNLDGINMRIREIIVALHFNYPTNDRANALLNVGPDGFVEPLKFAGVESKPRTVGAEVWADRPGQIAAGLARKVYFSGARRIQHIGVMS